jgi:hypothetical protein
LKLSAARAFFGGRSAAMRAGVSRRLLPFEIFFHLLS